MEEERLQDALWWQRLTGRYRDKLAAALQHAHAHAHGQPQHAQPQHAQNAQNAQAPPLIACIPQTCSLASDAISETDVLHHLLRPVKGAARGEFVTLTGRKVTITGAEITTGAGFPHKRVVKILYSQTVGTGLPLPPLAAQPGAASASSAATSSTATAATIATAAASGPPVGAASSSTGTSTHTGGGESSGRTGGVAASAQANALAAARAASSAGAVSGAGGAGAAAPAGRPPSGAGARGGAGGALSASSGDSSASSHGAADAGGAAGRGVHLPPVNTTLAEALHVDRSRSASMASTGSGRSRRTETPTFHGAPIRVYYLSQPLDGGISAPASIEEMDDATIASFVAMLRSAPETEPELEALRAVVKRAIRDIEGRSPSAPCPPVESRLQAQCSAAAERMLSTSLFEEEPASARPVIQRQILQVLESWTVEQLHAPVMAALTASMRGEIDQLGAVLSRLAGLSQDEIGVKPRFQTDLSEPLRLLARLPSVPTALAKLHLLRDVSAAVRLAIEQRLRANGEDIAEVDFSTDDTLDVLLYLLLKGHPTARVAELPAQLEFIERFHFASMGGLHRSTLGYHVANFHQAMGYFQGRAAELGL